MFELIGLVIGTAILLGMSLVAGMLCAGLTFLIFRNRPRRRIRLMVLAAAIPLCSAAYIWVCAALLPGQTLFGDINEPLPNGFILKGLGKMPQYSQIERQDGSSFYDGVHGVVDRIAVKGQFVAGRYCQSCDPAFVRSKAPYFLFDTRTSTTSDYSDLAGLQAVFGSATPLVESEFFRSQEPRYVRQQQLEHCVMFIPPIGSSLIFLAYILRRRHRESSRLASNLY